VCVLTNKAIRTGSKYTGIVLHLGFGANRGGIWGGLNIVRIILLIYFLKIVQYVAFSHTFTANINACKAVTAGYKTRSCLKQVEKRVICDSVSKPIRINTVS